MIDAEFATLVSAAIAALAALGAAYFSYAASTRSSRLKIAEYRRDWIENLRGELSSFYALTLDRMELQEQQDTNFSSGRSDIDQVFDRYAADIRQTVSQQMRHLANSRLSLNPRQNDRDHDNANHYELDEWLVGLSKLKTYAELKSYEEKSGTLESKARPVLKGAWDKVRAETYYGTIDKPKKSKRPAARYV